MGQQQPALLLRRVLNVERAPEVRRERLSSGVYELATVRCRMCHTELGWRYLSASSQARLPREVFVCTHGEMLGSLCRCCGWRPLVGGVVRAGAHVLSPLPDWASPTSPLLLMQTQQTPLLDMHPGVCGSAACPVQPL